MLLLVLSWCLLCCAFALWSQRRWRLLKLTEKVPTLSGELPLLGHAHRGIGDKVHLWEFIKDLNTETIEAGGWTKGWIGPKFYMSVTDPEMALTVSNTCLAKDYMYNFASSWLGQGLITSELSTWRSHRKLLCSAFNPTVLEGFMEVFNRNSINLTERLRGKAGKGKFDHWPYFSDHALAMICQTAFGLQEETEVVDREYADAVAQMLQACVTRATHVWMHLDLLYRFSSTKKKEDQAVAILNRTSLNIIEKRKAYLKQDKLNDNSSPGRRFKAFLDLLLELGEDGKLNDQEIREEVDTMIVAGHDTTSHTLLFLFVLLGSYPEVQEKVFQEVNEVLGDTDRHITKDELSLLVYTEAVIKETCRLYPVIPMLVRCADKDVQFENFTIPAGTGIMLCLWGIQRSKCWGEDVDHFNPDRWLDPARLPESQAAFAVFSLGRRGCMGKTQAMMSLKTTVAHVVRTFKVKADYTKMKIKFDFMIKPVSGHHIQLELR